MKKTFTQCLLIFTTILFVSACSKKSSLSPNGSMTSKVNGASWKADSGNAGPRGDFAYTYQIEGYHGTFGAAGSTAIFWSLFAVPHSGQTDTIGSTTGPLVSATYYTGTTPHYAASGQITITNVTDSTIQGSFEFTTTDSITVTDGSFNIPVTPNMF